MTFFRQNSFYWNVSWFELRRSSWNRIHTLSGCMKPNNRRQICLQIFIFIFTFIKALAISLDLSVPATSSERLGASPRLSVPSSTGPTFSMAASCGVVAFKNTDIYITAGTDWLFHTNHFTGYITTNNLLMEAKPVRNTSQTTMQLNNNQIFGFTC